MVIIISHYIAFHPVLLLLPSSFVLDTSPSFKKRNKLSALFWKKLENGKKHAVWKKHMQRSLDIFEPFSGFLFHLPLSFFSFLELLVNVKLSFFKLLLFPLLHFSVFILSFIFTVAAQLLSFSLLRHFILQLKQNEVCASSIFWRNGQYCKKIWQLWQSNDHNNCSGIVINSLFCGGFYSK